MKSKTSLFKKSLIISDLKRYWWVSALFTLVLLFALPLAHYMGFNSYNIHDNSDWFREAIKRDLIFRNGLSPFLPLVVPVVIAVLTYRYIQRARSASMYHSLPVTRTALYFNSFVSSLILYVTPLIITVLIMLVLNWFSFLSAFYTCYLIFKWLGYSLLFGIMFMSMTIFVGMFTGSSIAQIAFLYILNMLPIFLAAIIKETFYQLIFGFETYFDTAILDRLPLILLSDKRFGLLSPALTVVYIVITLLLLVGGLIAFKLRRPETAGDIITFLPIKPVFIFGVTICATLLGGAYFSGISNSSAPFVIFGYLISSLFGYAVVQMITNKTFKVQNTYKGYLAYLLVLIVVALGVRFDALGYVNKVPEPSQVSEVYMGSDLYWLRHKDDKNNSVQDISSADTYVFKKRENIENITKLHKLILENRSKEGMVQCLEYKLKNGKTMLRRYYINSDLYAPALGPVYESGEFKEGRFPILRQEANDLKYIEIQSPNEDKASTVISDKKQLDSFISVIRSDIKNLSYQELISDDMAKFRINVIDSKDNTITYALRSSYKNTLEWAADNK